MTNAFETPKAPLPLILRFLSGVGGVVVFLLGLIVSLGAILAAPAGIWLVRRRAQRRNLQVSRIAALVGSVVASMALATLLWSLLFALMPRPTQSQFQSATMRAQTRNPVKLPDWYTKAFPQAARYDSANRAMIQSPGFMRVAFILSAIFAGVFFGIVGGVFGWCASALVSLAWSGGRIPA
ncbi:MAG TPA: hypothetical protein VIW26_09485 [Gemmatimonadales bacterium]|jgi:hypothetical protein